MIAVTDDETPTAELARCPKCELPVELGTCCRGCGVLFDESCPRCGLRGYHADGCGPGPEEAP